MEPVSTLGCLTIAVVSWALARGADWTAHGGLAMNKRVLLVDDRTESAEPVEDALAEAGYEVVSASSGAECLRVADQASPDLVVLDAQMPGLDGVDTLRLLREIDDTRQLPVIVLSDEEGELESRLAWAAAADMYLTRPVSPRAIVAAANWLLQRPAKGLFRAL